MTFSSREEPLSEAEKEQIDKDVRLLSQTFLDVRETHSGVDTADSRAEQSRAEALLYSGIDDGEIAATDYAVNKEHDKGK